MTALPIDLPEGFSPLVSIGDIVTPGQILAQKATSKDEVVNVLQGLKISYTTCFIIIFYYWFWNIVRKYFGP